MAQRLLGDFQLQVEDQQLPVRGHAKAPRDMCKGVINTNPAESPARSYPASSSTTAWLRPYKKMVPVCTKCGTIGHRPPECPHPAPTQCFKCGTPAPAGLTAHDCHPECLLCHGAHETGTSGCAAKYRKHKQPSTCPQGTTSSSSQPDNGTDLHQSSPPFQANTQAFPLLVAPAAVPQVSSWAGTAASKPLSPPSVDPPSPELAALRQHAVTPATSKLSPRATSTPIKPPAPAAISTTAAGTSAASTPAALEAPVAPQVLLPANPTLPSEERVPRVEERLTWLPPPRRRTIYASVPLPASQYSEQDMEASGTDALTPFPFPQLTWLSAGRLGAPRIWPYSIPFWILLLCGGTSTCLLVHKAYMAIQIDFDLELPRDTPIVLAFFYIDVSDLSPSGHLTAAMVTEGKHIDGLSFRADTVTHAEEVAIALAASHPTSRTILTDSRSACSQYLQGSIAPLAAGLLQAASLALTLIPFKADERLLRRLQTNTFVSPAVARHFLPEIKGTCSTCQVLADTYHVVASCPANPLPFSSPFPIPTREAWVEHLLRCSTLAAQRSLVARARAAASSTGVPE
ncbi:hypothetical protein HPB50_023108 [Hyalomma asiaticum]|uniref:Uncharacterized protein n=1 Tax=Hyalomma asiaticum TaxID=266040 RepID=A0ACB7TME7_HYAAI|nr:hypothetical protein HPB50_023108 [Hyalomma asiaticum]